MREGVRLDQEELTVRTLTLAVFLTATTLVSTDISAQERSTSTSGSPNKPANLCQELIAFLRQPEAMKKAAEPSPQLATAVSAKKQGGDAEKPSAQGTPQQTSGQAGQITSSGPGAAGPQGDAQNTAAPAGSTATAAGSAKPTAQSAPSSPGQAVAKAGSAEPPAPKPTQENVQQVEAAARNNDLQGCRAVGQQMRRAGIAMPPPLIALSAMNPQLLEAAKLP